MKKLKAILSILFARHYFVIVKGDVVNNFPALPLYVRLKHYCKKVREQNAGLTDYEVQAAEKVFYQSKKRLKNG